MYSDGEEGSPVEDNEESESEDVVFLGRTPWVAYMERNLQDLNIDSLPYADSSDCSLSTGSEDESGLEEDVEAEQQEVAALRAERDRLRTLRDSRRMVLQEIRRRIDQVDCPVSTPISRENNEEDQETDEVQADMVDEAREFENDAQE